MSVYQVEEYYVFIDFKKEISQESVDAITELLSDEGYTDYEFQENNSKITVDDIPEEWQGQELEDQIESLVE